MPKNSSLSFDFFKVKNATNESSATNLITLPGGTLGFISPPKSTMKGQIVVPI